MDRGASSVPPSWLDRAVGRRGATSTRAATPRAKKAPAPRAPRLHRAIGPAAQRPGGGARHSQPAGVGVTRFCVVETNHPSFNLQRAVRPKQRWPPLEAGRIGLRGSAGPARRGEKRGVSRRCPCMAVVDLRLFLRRRPARDEASPAGAAEGWRKLPRLAVGRPTVAEERLALRGAGGKWGRAGIIATAI